MPTKIFYIVFFILMAQHSLNAQTIKGMVADREQKTALANVQLVNIFNEKICFTDSDGHFTIEANKGELVEVRAAGYHTTRFRISKGHVPPFFKLYLDKILLFDTNRFANSDLTAYQIDSIKSSELYSEALRYPKMSTFEQIESPFTALSRSNQMKWKFQEHYALFEREKFIDFTFNEQLIQQITGLEGEDLQRYMKRYRPSYESLRSMSMYDFYTYIRITGDRFKKNGKGRPTAPRNSG